MIRTMARNTDVHFLEEDNDVVELPKVNEDLRNFFLPRKHVAPEPEVEPEVQQAPVMEAAEDRLEYVKAAPADAAAIPEPVKALKAASMQAPQSPTSAYRPGAFDKHALAAPAATAPMKPAKKWFSFSKSKSSRLSKEYKTSRFSSFDNPSAAAAPVPKRFVEKHAPDMAVADKAEEPAAEEPVAESVTEPAHEEEIAATEEVEVPVETEEPAAEPVEATEELVHEPVEAVHKVVEEPAAEEAAVKEESAQIEAPTAKPIAADVTSVTDIEAEVPKEAAEEPAHDIEDPKEAHTEAVLATEPVMEAAEEKTGKEPIEEAAEEPVTHEAEAPVVSDDVSVPEALETDMHPIAEHPAAEAEAATETAAEEHAAPEETAEAAPAAEVEAGEPAVEPKEEDAASPEVTTVTEPGANHDVVREEVAAEEEGGEEAKVVDGAEGQGVSAQKPLAASSPAPAIPSKAATPAPKGQATCACCIVQ